VTASRGSKAQTSELGVDPSAKRAAVSGAVANWNGSACLPQCLGAFSRKRIPAEETIVDNGSTDGSQALIQDRYPRVRLIERPVNEGVAKGYDLAIAESRMPFLLILNTDVFLDRDFLCDALEAIRSASNLGMGICKDLQLGGRVASRVERRSRFKLSNNQRKTVTSFDRDSGPSIVGHWNCR
jgi:GT2 family glycosyltransferase